MLARYAAGHNALTPLLTICAGYVHRAKKINGPQDISNYQNKKRQMEAVTRPRDLFYKSSQVHWADKGLEETFCSVSHRVYLNWSDGQTLTSVLHWLVGWFSWAVSHFQEAKIITTSTACENVHFSLKSRNYLIAKVGKLALNSRNVIVIHDVQCDRGSF